MSQVFGLKSLLPQGEKGFRDEGKKICQSTSPPVYALLVATRGRGRGEPMGHFEPHWEMVGKENTKGKGDLNDICVNARS